MKLLIFNDSQSLEVQAVQQEGDDLRIRMIHVTPEEMKTLFRDEFLTRKMTLKEAGKEVAVYEKYTVFSYIKEDSGGIFEVEMIQAGKDTDTRLAETEQAAQDALVTANGAITALQDAVAELTTLISSMGGE